MTEGGDMQGGMMAQAVELMVYGMGTVFVFLGLLVLAISLMSGLINRYFPQPEPAPVAARLHSPGETVGAELDPGVVAVITAAIHRHRKIQ
jgi:oxaloacetate decarboxylase (Na+ extruding) subunit gamma